MDKRVPEVRFNGFTDDWEQQPLHKCLSLLKDGTHGTHKDVKNGPYLLSAKNIKNGHIIIDDSDRKISYQDFESIHRHFSLKVNDVLLTIVGSIGQSAVLSNPQNITFQRSVAYLRPKKINPFFLNLLINTLVFQKELKKKTVLSAQSGIYLGELGKININFPSDEKEQKQISALIDKLDIILDTIRENLSLYRRIKKTLLQGLFPKSSEQNPRIKDTYLHTEWIQYKLIDITTERNERSDTGELLSVTINNGVCKANQLNRKDNSSSNKSNYKVVHTNDIAYNSMRMWQGASGVSKYNGIVSPAYTVISVKENMLDSDFLGYILKLPQITWIFRTHSQGLTSDTWNLKYPLFSQISIRIPNLDAQRSIVRKLNIIDERIRNQEKIIKITENMKFYLLQKLFV